MRGRRCMGEYAKIENPIARVYEAGKMDFAEGRIREPGKNEVQIRIRASLICGSDLHIFKDRHPAVSLPVTIGHEFTGIVTKTGEAVTRFRKGDRVVVEPVLACGECDACRRGEYGYCENISFTYREGDGALAKYFTGKEERVYHLPENISFEKGALAEPLAVAVHAVKRAGVRLGECVVIAGAGAIGIMIAAVCKKLGAKTVVISDYSVPRLRMAQELGADIIVNAASEDLIERVMELTNGRGAEKAFECVGKESTFSQLLSCAKMNGLITDVGIFERPQINIDASSLVKRELRIQGAQGYCWDFDNSIQLLEELPLEKLITHRFPLEQVQKAIVTASDPESGAIKVCVIPEE